MSTQNSASWIPAAKSPLNVSSAPSRSAGPSDVVIKNAYVAVNPVDWKIQDYGFFLDIYPFILGTDVAGEVVEVGGEVKGFKEGDRVMGHCISLGTKDHANSAFQLYSVVPSIVVAPIPDSISFAQASVMPLSISTASAGLYQKDYLSLPYPTKGPKSTGKTILLWGGSSSVGSSAIQLAVASGLEVVTTASKQNFEYVKSLGAKHAFDHGSKDVVEEIVKVLGEGKIAGAYDAISDESTIKSCAEVVSKMGGGIVVTVLPPPEKGLPENVKTKGVSAVSIALQTKDVGHAVWHDFVPSALRDGRLKCKPDPMVIEGGLEKVQEGLDAQREGVSAAKVVVEL